MRLFRAVVGTLLSAGAGSFGADVSAIDAYVRAEIELNDVPGAAVAVWGKGDVTYAKGFGVRSTATNEPMTADTPVDLASLSKSLTAVAVYQLSRQGKIDVDAPVTKYLPELGGAFTRIRIRHLIRHTSGLTRRDDFRVPCCGQPGEHDLDIAPARLAVTKPSRPPGAEFAYANSNYVLLAAVVQRVSGQSFQAFMRESVFRPLGMFRTTLDPVEARRWGLADPHERRWRKVRSSRSPFLGWYGSSLVKSTARDMAGYLGSVLSRAGRDQSEPYDGGWFIRRGHAWPGSPVVLEHGGDTWGGNTAAIVVPAWGMGAVVLLNVGAHRATQIARGVLARSAGLAAPPAEKAPATTDMDAWAIILTTSGALMLGAASVYARKVWFAVIRRDRHVSLRPWTVARSALLLAMAATLVFLMGAAPLRAAPESLRRAVSMLGISSALVIALAAVLGLMPRAASRRSETVNQSRAP